MNSDKVIACRDPITASTVIISAKKKKLQMLTDLVQQLSTILTKYTTKNKIVATKKSTSASGDLKNKNLIYSLIKR